MPGIDLLTIGRVNLDLYAQEIGVPFDSVAGFDAMVGGSPVNVAVAAARLGVRAGVFTAVGEDLVGDWVLGALEREGVDTTFALRKSGPHTSLALLAQVPPEHPLAFYRHDPADVHLTIDDTAGLPLEHIHALLVSADGLARGSTSEACRWILGAAQAGPATVYIDLDLRPVNWPDLDAYADAAREAIDRSQVVLGTVAEFAALLRLSDDEAEETVLGAVQPLSLLDPARVLIVKRGARGATLFVGDETIHVPARPVREASTVGAGDSFAAGLIGGRLDGLGWAQAARLAADCAAITVSRFGCSRGFPRTEEIDREAVGAANGA